MSMMTNTELELLLDCLDNFHAVFLHNQVEMCAQKLPQEENSVIVF